MECFFDLKVIIEGLVNGKKIYTVNRQLFAAIYGDNIEISNEEEEVYFWTWVISLQDLGNVEANKDGEVELVLRKMTWKVLPEYKNSDGTLKGNIELEDGIYIDIERYKNVCDWDKPNEVIPFL